jgi:hypothetical protein
VRQWNSEAINSASSLVTGPDQQPRRTEELFRSMYQHAAADVEQVAVNIRLLMVNAALCRMLGLLQSRIDARYAVLEEQH